MIKKKSQGDFPGDEGEEKTERLQSHTRKLLGIISMLLISLVISSQMNTCEKVNQVIYFKCTH